MARPIEPLHYAVIVENDRPTGIWCGLASVPIPDGAIPVTEAEASRVKALLPRNTQRQSDGDGLAGRVDQLEQTVAAMVKEALATRIPQ